MKLCVYIHNNCSLFTVVGYYDKVDTFIQSSVHQTVHQHAQHVVNDRQITIQLKYAIN